jgi:hypothetical protein
VSVLLVWALAGTAQASAEPLKGPPDRIVFPVVGNVQYENDFGEPRGQGPHEGNDILADWRAPAVAAEAGTVRTYTSSASAGCMLYLFGKSGTTYLYIHLNNDLGSENDNEGGCKRGVAYAPGLQDGEKVRAGELLGYVGDSGDANGIAYHLHFELHPDNGRAVSPFRWLKRAERLLFAVPEKAQRTAAEATTLTLVGVVVDTGDTQPQAARTQADPPPPPPPPPPSSEPAEDVPPPDDSGADGSGGEPGGVNGTDGALLTIRVGSVRLSTGEVFKVTRRVTLTVPPDAVFERSTEARRGPRGLTALEPGDKVTVTTAPVDLSLATQRARPGVLLAARVLLR